MRHFAGWIIGSALRVGLALIVLGAGFTAVHAAPGTPKSLLRGLDDDTKVVSLKKLIKSPVKYHGDPVLTTGFLVRDETRYLLFEEVDDYEKWQLENAIVLLDLPDTAVRSWEKFERAYVHVAGRFEAPCGDKRKRRNSLDVTTVPLGEKYGDPISVCEGTDIAAPFIGEVVLAEREKQHSVEVGPDHPHYWREFEWKGLFWGERGGIADAANGFFSAVKRRDFDTLMAYFGPGVPPQLRRDLGNSRSVISERLYGGENSVSDVLGITNITGLKIGVDNREWGAKGEPPYAFACLCKKMICLGDWKPPRFGMVTDVDPIACIGLERGQNRWYVDYYPFLTPGTPYEGLAW